MKNEKLYVMSCEEKFDNVVTKIATQDVLTDVKNGLLEKIQELESKLEKVKSKMWKFKVGDVVAYNKFTFKITELVDNDPNILYKAEKFDYYGVIKNAGYDISLYYGVIKTFTKEDKLIKIGSIEDYTSYLFNLLVDKEQKSL